VDDATAGADSKEWLIALSKEMEAVAKRGGFEFKETLMSGHKEDDDGEPRKVLGLIWETEADRLKVDVKLNLGAKRAGLHLRENIELSEDRRKHSRKLSRNGSYGGWHRASTTRWGCYASSPSASRS
jgi:hypothetical protein